MEGDQDVLCALGNVTKSDSPASDSFDLVAGYYIISTRSYFRQTNICSINSRKYMSKNQLRQRKKSLTHCMKTAFILNCTRVLEGGVRFSRHSHNIMLSGKFVQWTPAVEDLTSKQHGAT